MFGGIVLPFLYGYHPKSWKEDDPIVLGGMHGMEVFSQVTRFGVFLVDSIPLGRSLASSIYPFI